MKTEKYKKLSRIRNGVETIPSILRRKSLKLDEFNASKIGSNLIAVSNFYDHRSTEIQKKAYPNMLGAANGYIISYLCENKDKNIFQRDIEREFDLSRSTVSTILKQLESEGLIERKSVIIDARLKKVVPTPAAEMINEACSKEITHFFYRC